MNYNRNTSEQGNIIVILGLAGIAAMGFLAISAILNPEAANALFNPF